MRLSCFFDKRSQDTRDSPKDFSAKLRYHSFRTVQKDRIHKIRGGKRVEVIFEVSENVLVARLLGELDHHAAARVRGDIDRALETHALKNLVFDFEKVTYMDGSGIGVVLGRYRRLSENGGRVAIAACIKSVRTILNMAGIFSLMAYADTNVEAAELLKGKEVAEWRNY